MTVDRNALATAFPEFGNVTTYPNGQVDFWINQALISLSPARFGRQFDLAVMLFVAHNLALSVPAKRAEAISPGGAASVSIAPVASKAVDGVSKSYDNGLVAIAGAGPWNATSYGQRFYKMLQAANSGPLYRVSPRAFPCGSRRFISPPYQAPVAPPVTTPDPSPDPTGSDLDFSDPDNSGLFPALNA